MTEKKLPAAIQRMVDEAPLLSAKARIAVALKMPASGDKELDNMIMGSLYRDVALAVLPSIIAKHPPSEADAGADETCRMAVCGAFDYAEAFLDHLAGETE